MKSIQPRIILRLNYNIYFNNSEENDSNSLTKKEGSMNPCIMTLQRMWVSLCTQKQKEVSLFGFPKHEQLSSVHIYKTWKNFTHKIRCLRYLEPLSLYFFIRTNIPPFPEVINASESFLWKFRKYNKIALATTENLVNQSLKCFCVLDESIDCWNIDSY